MAVARTKEAELIRLRHLPMSRWQPLRPVAEFDKEEELYALGKCF